MSVAARLFNNIMQSFNLHQNSFSFFHSFFIYLFTNLFISFVFFLTYFFIIYSIYV